MENENFVCLVVNLFFFGLFFWMGCILGNFKARRKFKAEIKLREEYEMSMKMWNEFMQTMQGGQNGK